MAEIKLQEAHRVDIIESEIEAKNFVKNFNKGNTEEVVPDWYMYATYMGRAR